MSAAYSFSFRKVWVGRGGTPWSETCLEARPGTEGRVRIVRRAADPAVSRGKRKLRRVRTQRRTRSRLSLLHPRPPFPDPRLGNLASPEPTPVLRLLLRMRPPQRPPLSLQTPTPSGQLSQDPPRSRCDVASRLGRRSHLTLARPHEKVEADPGRSRALEMDQPSPLRSASRAAVGPNSLRDRGALRRQPGRVLTRVCQTL